jgi:hypothetical protein
MDSQATKVDRVSPFADTARKQRGWTVHKVPTPQAYWENPGLHGRGRQVSLRGTPTSPVVRPRKHEEITGRLPVRPSSSGPGAVHVLLGVGAVVGIGAALYWWHKRQQSTSTTATTKSAGGKHSHVGDDYCGFDDIGCD